MRCACGVENKVTNTFCTECGERLIRGTPAADLDDQTAVAQPDATRLADPPSPPEADREVKTRLQESHTVKADRTKAKEQSVPTEWKVGDAILDLYEVKEIHEGGRMGRVYRVHHQQWNTDLAVKSPRAEQFKTDAQRENFVRECETWIQLGMHPHIVSCHYVRTIGKVPNVFAEYVEGGSLHDWIEDRRLYEGGKEEALRRILDISIQFAWGLHYAHTHEQGLIHQDVKPGNVLITPEGETKVTDFGLARARGVAGAAASKVGERGTIMVASGGMTPAYCSPEQAEGKLLSRKTDIWSWGLSVLEMFTGERTWRSGTLAMVALDEYLTTGAENESIPRMPEALAKLLKKCFQQNPTDRPEDFQEIVKVLTSIYEYKDKNKDEGKGEEYPREEPKAVELLADGLNNRALSMLDLGKRDEAEHIFNEALAADPHHPESTYNRGLFLWRSAQITDDELVRQLEEIRTTHQDNWHIEYLLGQVHLERRDMQSAIKIFEKALGLGGAPIVEEAIEQTRHALQDSLSCIQTFEGHGKSWVASVYLSVDGRWALSGSYDNALYLWKVANGQCVRVFEGHTDSVTSVLLNNNCRWALSGSRDKTLRFWEVSTGRCVRTFQGHEHWVNSVSLSYDGRWALSGSGDKTLRLWEISSGNCVQVFEGHMEAVNSVCLSIDDRWALSGSGDKTLRLWDVSSGMCVRIFKGHLNWVSSVFLSDDGRWALSGSNDGTVRLWEVSSGRCMQTFRGHADIVNSVTMSSDRCWALSGSNDGTIRLWEVSSGRCVRTLEGHHAYVSSVSLSADSRLALSGSFDNTLRLWRVNLPRSGLWQTAASAMMCRIKPARETIDMRSKYTECLRLAKVAKEAGECKEAIEYIRKARAIPAYKRTQEILELWNQIGVYCQRSKFLGAWCARTFERRHLFWIYAVCLSADGRWALSGSYDKYLCLWEVSSGRCLRNFKVSSEVTSVFLGTNGRWALSGSRDKSLRLWDVSSGRCIRAFEGHTDVVNAVSLSPDGLWALSGSDDNTLRLWEVSSGRCVRVLRGHSGRVYSISLSADGGRVLSGSNDNTLRLWEVSSGRCLQTFKGHENSVNSVSLSIDGQWALSGSYDKTVRLWEVSSGRCVRIFEGSQREVTSVALSADGRWALSGSHDAMLRLWEVSSGRCLRIFKGHTEVVNSVSFSADSRWVLSGSEDMTLRLWELDWDYDFPGWKDWDKRIRAYIENFLTLLKPYAGTLPTSHAFSEEEVQLALTRHGKPIWNDDDFNKLIYTLSCAGYGWLRQEGIKQELEKMIPEWKGQIPLAKESIIKPLRISITAGSANPIFSESQDAGSKSEEKIADRLYDAKMKIVKLLQSVVTKGGQYASFLEEMAESIEEEAKFAKSENVPISYYRDDTGHCNWAKKHDIAFLSTALVEMGEPEAAAKLKGLIEIFNNLKL